LSSLNSLFKHTFIYGLSTVLPRLLTLLLTPLLTAYLPSESAFGEVSLVFSWIIVCNVVLTYGMETAFFRFYSHSDQQHRVLSTALISLLLTSAVFAVFAFLFLDPIESATAISACYWRWVIGIITLDTLMVIPFAHLRARKKSVTYAQIKLLNVIISTGTAALFLIWLPEMAGLNQWLPSDKIELFFIAFFGASFITLLLVSKVYFVSSSFDTQLLKKMLGYGFPILIAGLAFAVNETFDKILLQWLSPEAIAKEQVGIYTACYRLAIGMTLYATAFKLGVEPFFFSESKDKKATVMYAHITKVFVALGAIALFVYIVLVDLIKPLLIRKEGYWEAMDVVPLVLFAFFFFGIYQTLSVWYKVTDRTKFGAYISIIGAIATIAINLAFIPRFGYMASAVATCVAYGVMMVISYVLGRKHYPIPYDLGNLVTYILLSVVFSSVFFYFFRDYFGIGSWQLYLVGAMMTAVLIGVIVLKEKDFFKQLLRQK
jgi:O-antigen/teichoic acid export membrane protein